MKTDYIYYLAVIYFVLSLMSLLVTKDVEVKWEHEFIGFMVFGLPIAGRVIGWW